MTLKVVNIPARSVDKVVNTLEILLADAKEGKIRNICFAAEYNTFVRTESTGACDTFSVLGHIDRMKFILHRQMDIEETE